MILKHLQILRTRQRMISTFYEAEMDIIPVHMIKKAQCSFPRHTLIQITLKHTNRKIDWKWTA